MHRRVASGWPARAAAIALVAATARALTLADTSYYRPIHDDAAYARLARSIVSLGQFPVHHVAGVGWLASSYRPPGWPVTLAGIWSLTGIGVGSARLALLVLGVVTCLLGAQVARRIAGDAAGLIAGLALALDPLMLMGGASLESEVLGTALIVGALLAALRARQDASLRFALVAGALIGTAALTRTNALPLVPVVAWLSVPERPARDRLRPAVMAVCAACLVIAPWTVRNEIAFHRFVPVSTETGNTLAGTYNTTSLHHDARWLEPRHTGAYHQIYRRYVAGPALDSHLVAAVFDWTKQHPAYPLVVLGWNAARLLGFDGPGWARMSLQTMSLDGQFALAIWLSTMLVTVLAAVEVARRRRATRGLVLVSAVLLLSTAVANGEMRLAIPLQAVLVVLAACALARPAAGDRETGGPRAALGPLSAAGR